MALEREIATYDRLLPELLADEGKYVVIHGETVIGKYDSLEEAISEGTARYLHEPFLARQILAVQPVYRLPIRFQLWPSSSDSGDKTEPSSMS